MRKISREDAIQNLLLRLCILARSNREDSVLHVPFSSIDFELAYGPATTTM
jgi:hypothetical protein